MAYWAITLVYADITFPREIDALQSKGYNITTA